MRVHRLRVQAYRHPSAMLNQQADAALAHASDDARHWIDTLWAGFMERHRGRAA